jgi:nucleoid DNA-binding protein
MQKTVQKKLKEIAEKYNIPEKEVQKAFEAQFQLIKQTAEEADRQDSSTFKNIRLIKFGLFYVKEAVKKAYINNDEIKPNKKY